MGDQEVYVAPDSVASPTSTTEATSASTLNDSVQAQPTYTTAGTIYNPTSAAPLQPPLRRGRSFKNQSDRSGTVVSYTPQSQGENQGYNQPAHEQYSPLQQNYDRAARPQERALPNEQASMVPTGPRMHSGNTPSAQRPPRSDLQAMQDSIDDSSSSDDDYDALEQNALKSMSVKSLQNLASYPNPNQSAARRVLALGGLNGRRLVRRQKNCSQVEAEASTNNARSRQWDDASPTSAPPEQKHTSYAAALGQDLYSTELGRAHPDEYDNRPAAVKSGVKLPRPLTAGPPGQRQYRASNREDGLVASTTAKQAFSEDSTTQYLHHGPVGWQNEHTNCENAIAAATEACVWPALGTDQVASDGVGRNGHPLRPHSTASFSPSAGPTTAKYPFDCECEPFCGDALNTNGFCAEAENGLWSNCFSGTTASSHNEVDLDWVFKHYSGPYGISCDSCGSLEEQPLNSKRAGTPVLQTPRYSPEGFQYKSIGEIRECTPLPQTVSAQCELERHNDTWALACAPPAAVSSNNRLNQVHYCWYEGTHMMGNKSCYIIEDLRGQKKNPLGAIGDGRPEKVSHKKAITVEQAKEKTTPEHIDPLLQMLFATLVVNLEKDKEQDDSKSDA